MFPSLKLQLNTQWLWFLIRPPCSIHHGQPWLLDTCLSAHPCRLSCCLPGCSESISLAALFLWLTCKCWWSSWPGFALLSELLLPAGYAQNPSLTPSEKKCMVPLSNLILFHLPFVLTWFLQPGTWGASLISPTFATPTSISSPNQILDVFPSLYCHPMTLICGIPYTQHFWDYLKFKCK